MRREGPGRADLAGRVVFLTGAGKGLGAEMARQLTERGARLALVDIRDDDLRRVAAQPGGEIWSERLDVTDQIAVERALSEVVGRFGGVDVVVANAGVNAIGPVAEMETTDFERVVEVDLLGVYRTVRACLPSLIARRGYVLCIASVAALVQGPFHAPYNAAKAGVHAFCNTLRQELAPLGVSVGVVYPNAIDTESGRAALEHPLIAPLGFARYMRPVPVSEAARIVVNGIARRSRTIYIPRSGKVAAQMPISILQRVVDKLVVRRLRHSG